MALPINVSDLIKRRVVESTRVEYKKDWNPEVIIHSICAFANDIDNVGGGYIIVGIEEENGMPKFPIMGLQKNSIDKINKELLQKCNLIEPRYIPVVEQTQFEAEEIIIIWIPSGNNGPYNCPEFVNGENAKKSNRYYYIRKLSNTIRANREEEQELFDYSSNIPFDDRINAKADIEDMKPSLISEYLHAVNSDLYEESLNRSLTEIGNDMRIIGGPQEYKKPINVGLMFFSERPDNYFNYARIEVVDKPDPTGIGMTEKVFYGPLDRQLRDALSYIKNYVIKEKITKLNDRAEAERIYNYPFMAIEETLSNAVYHKSYQIGEPITVTITPDKMEITSIPGPDRTITNEDMKNLKMVSRRYRNRRIGDFLKELKLIEGRNTGIPTIVRAMEQNGSEKPIFETDEDRSYLTVVLPCHASFIKTEKEINNSEIKSRKSIEEIMKLIITALKQNGEMSSKKLAEVMGYTKVTEAVAKAIKQLMIDGKIEYTIKDNVKDKNQRIKLK